MKRSFTTFKAAVFFILTSAAVHITKSSCPDECMCQEKSMRCSNVMHVPKYPAYIKNLVLVNNAIMDLKHSDFPHNKLVTLSLSNNKIREIEENTFDDLIKLKHVDLSNNSLRTLNPGVFKHNKQLRELHLDNNHDLSFSLAELPESLECLSVMNTNSVMTYDILEKFENLRNFRGNFCLKNCSQGTEMEVTIYHNENPDITVQTTTEKSRTEKTQMDGKENLQIQESQCRSGWQVITCSSCVVVVVIAALSFFFWKLYQCYQANNGSGYQNVPHNSSQNTLLSEK